MARTRLPRLESRPRSTPHSPLYGGTCGVYALAHVLGLNPRKVADIFGPERYQQIQQNGMGIEEIFRMLERSNLRALLVSVRGDAKAGPAPDGDWRWMRLHKRYWTTLGDPATPKSKVWTSPGPPVPGLMSKERIPFRVTIGGLIKGFKGRRIIARVTAPSGRGHAVAWHPRLGYYDNLEPECFTKFITKPRRPRSEVGWFIVIGSKEEQPQSVNPDAYGIDFPPLDPILFGGPFSGRPRTSSKPPPEV